MADSEGGGRKWLACGCFGCLAVIVVLILSVVGVFGTAWVGVKNQQVQDRTLTPEIRRGATTAGARPGRVRLRLNGGEFHVTPARAGEDLRVEASYDERSYQLTERFEPGAESWTYEIDFERKGSMLMGILKSVVGGAGSRVEVFLPPDVPLELEVDISQGGSEMELGGLWLTSAAIEFTQGGFALDVSEPLRQPLDRMSIHGSMGGFSAAHLGHASPRDLDVELSMGGMELDLRGDWSVDSEISIRSRQGGASVQLPRDVNIVGIDAGGMTPRRDDEVPRPTLTFSVSSEQGEIEFR